MPAVKSNFANLVAHLPAATLLLDTRGSVLAANREAKVLLEWTELNSENRSLETFMTADGRQVFRGVVRSVCDTGRSARVEFDLQTPGKKSKQIILRIARWQPDSGADQEVYCVCCLEDNTQDRQLIAQLSGREAGLAAAQRIAHFGSWELHLTPTPTNEPLKIIWSDETYRIFGHEPQSFAVNQDLFLSQVHPQDRPLVREAVNRVLRDGGRYTVDHRIIRPDGDIRHLHEEGELVVDPATGQPRLLLGAAYDMTHQVRAEAEIRRLATRLTSTLESITEAFLLYDNQWKLTYLNREGERLLRRRREELLGKVVWDVFPVSSQSRMHAECHRALKERIPIEFEERFQELGTWFDVRIYPSMDGLAVYMRDITRRKQSDEQLRLLQKSISHLNDIVLITEAEPMDSPGPKIVFVNEAFTRQTGYAASEVIGKTPRMLQGPLTDREALDRIRINLRRLRPVREELINYTKLGKPYWIELEIVPVADPSGVYTHWVAIERDISERKQAELKLRESEQRARIVARVTNDAIRDWDLVRQQVEWNDGFESLFGYKRDSLGHGPEAWARLIHPEDRERVLTRLDALLAGDDTSWNEEYRFRRQDGCFAYVIDRAFVIRDAQGQGIRLVGGLTDITTRQEAAEALKRSQEELEERVRARTAQLTSANKQLSEFASVVSHDLKAPLRGVGNLAEWIAKDYGQQLGSKGTELFLMLRDRVRQMHGLIEGILAYTKIGQTQASEQAVDLNRLLEELIELLAPPDHITIERPKESIVLQGIPEQVHQVFQNILDNAIKFLDKPQGHIRILAQRESEPPAWTFTISDNGPGIPERHHRRIFQLFQRLHNDSVHEGSGIGLALVKSVVEARGGSIRVESVEGQGTTFHFVWPDHNKMLDS